SNPGRGSWRPSHPSPERWGSGHPAFVSRRFATWTPFAARLVGSSKHSMFDIVKETSDVCAIHCGRKDALSTQDGGLWSIWLLFGLTRAGYDDQSPSFI